VRHVIASKMLQHSRKVTNQGRRILLQYALWPNLCCGHTQLQVHQQKRPCQGVMTFRLMTDLPESKRKEIMHVNNCAASPSFVDTLQQYVVSVNMVVLISQAGN